MTPSVARTIVDAVRISREHARSAEVWCEIALRSIALLREKDIRIRAQDQRIAMLLQEWREWRDRGMGKAAA